MKNYLTAKQVRTKLGGISRTQLWRLRKHPHYRQRNFPKGEELSPGILVWDDEEIDHWLASPKKSEHSSLLDLAISVLQAASGSISVRRKV